MCKGWKLEELCGRLHFSNNIHNIISHPTSPYILFLQCDYDTLPIEKAYVLTF